MRIYDYVFRLDVLCVSSELVVLVQYAFQYTVISTVQ